MEAPVAPFRKRTIQSPALLVGLAGAAWVVGQGYWLNFPWIFYCGLVAALTILVLAKLHWRESAGFNLAANTAILFIAGLPLADLVYSSGVIAIQRKAVQAPARENAYSFEAAKEDPIQFSLWWEKFIKEWSRLKRRITVPDPEERLPFRLKPGSTGAFFDAQFNINSLGFRDREFEIEKGNRYRIVTLGESTTMGVTLKKDDRPWPKVLEAILQTELRCSRPIEVINAGVAAYDLQHNLIRLKRDVLRLKPDMIISYHGYNGFHFLDDSWQDLAHAYAPATLPAFIERPIALLAQVEHRIRLIRFKRNHFHPAPSRETVARLHSGILQTRYARLYEQLIGIARTNQIKLVLLNFNMAANQNSPKPVVNFYALAFPDVGFRIQANQLQTHLLATLADLNRDVLFVNTGRGLDGVHSRYIDLVHLTQEGRDQLAQNVCLGIREYLLSVEDLGCREDNRR